jgi:molybdenum cofactor cytidylyltransferase
MNTETAIVVLAAGAGSRYLGPRHKLRESLGGETVLGRTVRNALASRMPVVVVVSEAIAPDIAGLVPAGDLVVVDARSQLNWGMGDSIAAGVGMRATANGWLVLPGDMPLVQPASLRAVAAALSLQPITFAQYRGHRGHPVGFDAELFSDLAMLKGDEGARRLVKRYPDAPVELDDPGVLIDIDTIEDLADVRRRLGLSDIDALPHSSASSSS